jgi:cytochrome o ubiquinol oxidase subunit 2
VPLSICYNWHKYYGVAAADYKENGMSKKYRFMLLGFVVVAVLVIAGVYLAHTNIPVLEPRGIIAEKERNLIVFALLLSLVVVIPVFTLLFVFSWKYRETNKKNVRYSPELSGNRYAEALWWFIPSLLILILAIVTWNSSHALDPYKPIVSSVRPITVQVVSLDWKWLFIYPEQQIASVNLVEFPVGTPVNFELTSDAPMNSFWIPQLGGQIYAMPGMSTELHLEASYLGSYAGSSANISGDGFAGMDFTAQADSPSEFNSWVQTVKASGQSLTQQSYASLAKPSENSPVHYYASTVDNLYDTILLKYLAPASEAGQGGQYMSTMEGMGM